jgi:hypothetical protein
MGTACPGKLQRRGGYWRYGSSESEEQDTLVLCYRCPLSGRCFSEIPEGMMPYRALEVEEAGAYADQQSQGDSFQCDSGSVEKVMVIANGASQRRSWQSFWSAFGAHAMILAGMMGIDLGSNPDEVWRTLRGSGNNRRSVGAILIELHSYQTSLTKSYLSLKPWWAGGLARGP